MNPILSQYLDECRLRLSHKSVVNYERRVQAFVTFLELRPNPPQWNKAEVVDFMTLLQRKRVGQASIYISETCIRSFYTWLANRGTIAHNQLQGPYLSGYVAKPRPYSFAFTQAEYERLLEYVMEERPRWYGLVLTAWCTGLRLGDIAELKWLEVDLPNCRISLQPQKTIRRTGKYLDIPILSDLSIYLHTLPRTEPYVFPWAAKIYGRVTGQSVLSNSFRRVLKRLKIKGKSFHSLRHSATSRLLNAGVPLAVISSITGHSLGVLNRYSHVSMDQKREAMKNLAA